MKNFTSITTNVPASTETVPVSSIAPASAKQSAYEEAKARFKQQENRVTPANELLDKIFESIKSNFTPEQQELFLMNINKYILSEISSCNAAQKRFCKRRSERSHLFHDIDNRCMTYKISCRGIYSILKPAISGYIKSKDFLDYEEDALISEYADGKTYLEHCVDSHIDNPSKHMPDRRNLTAKFKCMFRGF